MRSGYMPSEELQHILAALMPANRLACEISLATGLRIGDVLYLRRSDLEKGRRFSIREQKTGKVKTVYLPEKLHAIALANCGKLWVFEGRLNGRRPRTRQAVYKDLRRVAAVFRLKAHISPHSLRKAWAVDAYRASGGDLQRVQRLLNHSNEAVTMLYAFADELANRRGGGGGHGAAR